MSASPSRDELRKLLKAAKRRYERLHWGIDAPRELSRWKAPDPRRGPLVELGALVAVEYETEKGNDGLSTYRHAFGNDDGARCPILAVNGENKLIIVGGYYTVTTDGIIG